MKEIILGALFLFYSLSTSAQTVTDTQVNDTSSFSTLEEVVIKAYEHNRKLIDIAAPVAYTGQQQLNRFSNTSILPALNQSPGIKMEERSPGSYRLNIRGSSLRSPFGVRDVKVYFDEIPLSDPLGNTYLNQLSFYNFQSIELIKGAAGSLYGAGIGGAMLIHSMPLQWQKAVALDYSLGSFNANNLNLNIKAGDSNHRNIFNYSHQSSDGYRQQSQMQRNIFSYESQLRISDRQTLHAFMLYSDLYYQTPGGLTFAQYDTNPRMARPHAGTNLSAVEAKASVYQKTFTTGFSNEYLFNDYWKNTTAVYGAYTNFINPGIRVYEIRKEPHFGGRTVFEFKKQIGQTVLQLNFGNEAQKGFFSTKDYANKFGTSDTLQTDDATNIWQYMIFAQADIKLPHGWIVTAGASFNKSSVQNTRLSKVPPTAQAQTFQNKIPPRLAVLKKISSTISVYASVAGGFSTPTTSELIHTNGTIGANLEPEDGIDYETGVRGSLFHDKLYFDVGGFVFDLNNTIVQRIDTNGVYYYVNAGSTKQKGIETYISYKIVDRANKFFDGTKLFVSYAFNNFHYGNFKQLNTDFSGNYMPGAAKNNFVAGLDVNTKPGLYTNLTYTYTDKVYLNDANTAAAPSYNLLNARIGYRKKISPKWGLEIFVGADNFLNTKYSLGNDINAAAGRYYNAAPTVSYFAGIALRNLFR
ncbi:MAG: TonB-dependent receptor plug domain-containing protein [Bacteroidetes bacterium]|nr:TonB-dependent receptor plug domain-containing protein [Bacteroidota bacterium]